MDFHAAVWNPGGILGQKGKCGSRQFQNMAFRPVLRHRPRQSRKTHRGNWHFTIRKRHPTSGFFFVMRLFCRKKRKILMLFIPSPRNRKIIEMRYSSLALQYSQYIRWKMEDDDAALAEADDRISCGAGRVSSGKSGRAEKSMVFRN